MHDQTGKSRANKHGKGILLYPKPNQKFSATFASPSAKSTSISPSLSARSSSTSSSKSLGKELIPR